MAKLQVLRTVRWESSRGEFVAEGFPTTGGELPIARLTTSDPKRIDAFTERKLPQNWVRLVQRGQELSVVTEHVTYGSFE